MKYGGLEGGYLPFLQALARVGATMKSAANLSSVKGATYVLLPSNLCFELWATDKDNVKILDVVRANVTVPSLHRNLR